MSAGCYSRRYTHSLYSLALPLKLAAYHSGSGPIEAIVVGAIASAITRLLGQMAFTTSPLVRAPLALLFAVPAAAASYHAALGLAHIAVPAEGWREAIADVGAIWERQRGYAWRSLSRPTPGKALLQA